MYRFKGIGFRPIDEMDLEIIRQNRNDIDTLLFLGNVDLVSSEQQKEWWKAISKSRTQQWFSVVNLESNELVGVLRFQNIDYINRSCEIGADVFKQYRGKGFGKLIYEMALEYFFNHLNMHTIYLKVADFNIRGIELYKKIGFFETGRLVQTIFRFGSYHDNILMCITEEQYKKRNK